MACGNPPQRCRSLRWQAIVGEVNAYALIGASVAALVTGCGTNPGPKFDSTPHASASPSPDGDTTSAMTEATAGSSAAYAHVTDVQVSGNPGATTFAVTVRSPDTGCEQFANWWEVLDEDGALVYRRILGHSHVEEQPFSRSGGPVDAGASDRLFVRAHMQPTGYGGTLFVGTIDDGFDVVPVGDPVPDRRVEDAEPQPDACAF